MANGFKVASILCLGLIFAASGDSFGQGEDPGKADIRGNITKATAADPKLKEVLGSIRVEGDKEKDTGYDKAVIRVTKKTKLEKMEGKERKAATFQDLKEGVRVQATFEGPVAESYPVQATAGSILILPAAGKK